DTQMPSPLSLHDALPISKCVSAQLPPGVLNANPGPDVPEISRIRQRHETTRMPERFVEESLAVRVATHDAIQRDDIRGRNPISKFDKVTVNELHGIGPSPARGLVQCCGHVR